MRIGIVTALFNREITEVLENGAINYLKSRGLEDHALVKVHVPGAFEIPLAAQSLFEKKQVDAVVAIGAVIRGDTTHYDYVCQAAERGCSEVALKYGKPVGFGVITTENDEQAWARAGGAHGNKGQDAASAVLDMLDVLTSLDA